MTPIKFTGNTLIHSSIIEAKPRHRQALSIENRIATRKKKLFVIQNKDKDDWMWIIPGEYISARKRGGFRRMTEKTFRDKHVGI